MTMAAAAADSNGQQNHQTIAKKVINRDLPLTTMDASESSKIHPRPRARTRRRGAALQEQRFSSYLAFGVTTTVCMVIFLLVYALTLLILSPLLNQEAPTESHIKRGDVLRPVVRSAVEKVKKMHHVGVPGQLLAEGMAGVVKKKFEKFRHRKGVTDEELLKKAVEESNALRKRKKALVEKIDRQHGGGSAGKKVVDAAAAAAAAPGGKRTGFVVLGMHRSGTSMLSGLMATGLGYHTGGPMIGGAFDNAKGFFERLDVVYQNDEFMNKQRVWWSANVLNFDAEKALQMKKDGTVSFKDGQKALNFFSDPKNSPWLQKDPRMCVTLKAWLPLLPSEPAVVFTYRHPMEVALSLKKRESDFPIERGLRLWIIYNMRAVQNSAGLCRVYSSNEAVFADPLMEVQRISDELTSKCGVPPPPEKLSKEDVDKFVDPSLQHNKKDENAGKEEIANYDGCPVHAYKSAAKEGTAEYQREHDLYLKAMKIYCDYKSGKAYEDAYEWPNLNP